VELFLFWLGFAVLCGIMASKRQRSGFGYFILAIVISPLLCALLLLAIGNANKEISDVTPETDVKCPDCRELVLKDARVCKHCGCKLIPQ